MVAALVAEQGALAKGRVFDLKLLGFQASKNFKRYVDGLYSRCILHT